MSSGIEENKNVEQVEAQLAKVTVSTVERRKELSKPTKDYSVNELVVSNLIRGLEMAIAGKEAEKVLGDSSLLVRSSGKTLVFVGDIMSFYKEGGNDVLSIGYLSVVGEKIGDVLTPIKGSISNLVAEKAFLNLHQIDFQHLSGKLLRGTTLMFTAKVVEEDGHISLEEVKVVDFGFRVFQKDGTADSLAIFNELVDTYKYEYFVVESGIVSENPYRNTSLDAYFKAFVTSEDQKPMEDALEYILGTYDDKYKEARNVLWGIIQPR